MCAWWCGSEENEWINEGLIYLLGKEGNRHGIYIPSSHMCIWSWMLYNPKDFVRPWALLDYAACSTTPIRPAIVITLCKLGYRAPQALDRKYKCSQYYLVFLSQITSHSQHVSNYIHTIPARATGYDMVSGCCRSISTGKGLFLFIRYCFLY